MNKNYRCSSPLPIFFLKRMNPFSWNYDPLHQYDHQTTSHQSFDYDHQEHLSYSFHGHEASVNTGQYRFHPHSTYGDADCRSLNTLETTPTVFATRSRVVECDSGSCSILSGRSDSNSAVAASANDATSAYATSPRAKEKSKNAARTRRANENMEYERLLQHLPLPLEEKKMQDKASIVRLTTNFLKLREFFTLNNGPEKYALPFKSSISDGILETIDGYPLILSGNGTILYIGESVKILLGLCKWEITGTNFIELVKKEDQSDFQGVFQLLPEEEARMDCLTKDFRFERRFTVRVKCLLNKRSNALGNNGFKAIHFSGYLTARTRHLAGGFKNEVHSLIGIANALPMVKRNSTEVKLTKEMFFFRASLELRLTYVDEQVEALTGHQQKDIVEASLYHLVHIEDIKSLAKYHRILLEKGQATGGYVRLLCRRGGWIWIQMHGTLNRSIRGSKSECIVGYVNVLTKIQARDQKFDERQITCDSLSDAETDVGVFLNPSRRKRRCQVIESNLNQEPQDLQDYMAEDEAYRSAAYYRSESATTSRYQPPEQSDLLDYFYYPNEEAHTPYSSNLMQNRGFLAMNTAHSQEFKTVSTDATNSFMGQLERQL